MAHSVGRGGRHRGRRVRGSRRLLAPQQGAQRVILFRCVNQRAMVVLKNQLPTLLFHAPLLFHSGAQDGEGRRRGLAPPQAHLPLLLLRALLPGVHGIVEGEEAEQIEGLPAEGNAHVVIGDHVSCLGRNTFMHQIHNQFHIHRPWTTLQCGVVRA